jgi:hypothetical protein
VEEVALLTGIRRSLLKHPEQHRDVIRRRMGLDGNAETLQQIGDHLGITRERVRQIEAKAVNRLRGEEYWDDLLASKLIELLDNRHFPLPVLGIEAADPWFAGVGDGPNVLRYVLDNICKSGANLVTIDGVEYIAFLDQGMWEATLQDARRLLEGGVGRQWSEEHCRSLVQGLLPADAKEFRELLWEKASRLCHFADGETAKRLLISYGRGAEQIVEAVLGACERPLHFSEIASLASVRAGREIDIRRAHNAAASVGVLLGRGTYGLEQHIGLTPEELGSLGEEAVEIVTDGLPSRQWHTSEILAALVERGSPQALSIDKYVLDIALQRSGGLEPLGRMVWRDRSDSAGDDGGRIDVRQAVIALLQQAGKPLRTTEIRQRLVAIRGVNDHFQIAAADPLIRLEAALWGLNDRDIAIKRADQPSF